jgi:hypothetical protein
MIPDDVDVDLSGLVLGGNFSLIDTYKYQMFSGIGDAEDSCRKYFLYIEEGGRRWVVSATDENCAEYIYVDGGKGSQGFGGARLRFQLAPCGYVEFEGPWHSNSDSFFKATGIDVRDKYRTWGIVARRRTFVKNENMGSTMPYILEDILHFDPMPVLGRFNRVRDIAQELADKLDETIYYFDSSRGGSSCGPMDPTHIREEKARNWKLGNRRSAQIKQG